MSAGHVFFNVAIALISNLEINCCNTNFKEESYLLGCPHSNGSCYCCSCGYSSMRLGCFFCCHHCCCWGTGSSAGSLEFLPGALFVPSYSQAQASVILPPLLPDILLGMGLCLPNSNSCAAQDCPCCGKDSCRDGRELY